MPIALARRGGKFANFYGTIKISEQSLNSNNLYLDHKKFNNERAQAKKRL